MLEESEKIHHSASLTKKEQIRHIGKYKAQHLKSEQQKTHALQALTDPLIGIWNRRAFLGDGDTGEIKGGNFIPHLTREIVEAKEGERRAKPSTPLTVLMLDIDRFKDINDNVNLKHEGGDVVLQSLAKLLNNNIRKADILGRLGGDEFLIILPRTNQINAIKEAERLRKLVESNQIEFNGKVIKITISVGVAEFNDSHKKSKDLVNNADDNLYQAKNRGRNQVFPQPTADFNLPK